MKSKQFFTGLIIGSILATSLNVFANDFVIPATRKFNFKIYVDGEEVSATDGGVVLSYNGVNYTSTRMVAEKLGATVVYQKNTVTGQERVDIKSKPDPEPIIIEVPTKQVETDDNEDEKNKTVYNLPPIKDVGLGVALTVTDVETINDLTYVRFDLVNKNTENLVMFDYSKIELVTDTGKVLKPSNTLKHIFLNSLEPDKEYKEEELIFEKIPEGTKFTLTLPINRRSPMDLNTVEEVNLKYNLIVEKLSIQNR